MLYSRTCTCSLYFQKVHTGPLHNDVMPKIDHFKVVVEGVVGVTAVHIIMQAFNNMASSGLVTRKFTRYRANTRESTSYMTETVCHPARSESRMVTCGPVR